MQYGYTIICLANNSILFIYLLFLFSLPSDEKEESGDGYCQVYRGATCSQFLQNKTVYVKSLASQSYMEEKLAAAFTVVATSQDVSLQCHKYAISSLCYFAFPLCNQDDDKPKPRQVIFTF